MLVFQEEHGIVTSYRGAQKAVRIESRRRVNDHQARRVRKKRRAGLRMVNSSALEITADRHANDHWCLDVSIGAPTHGGELVADLVKRREDVVKKLYFADGF